jgi:FkbM family methyltransferase
MMRTTDNRAITVRKAHDFRKGISMPVFILGTNKYGQSTAKWLTEAGYQVQGFINDSSDQEIFFGYPVQRSPAGYRSAAIINCIVEGRSIDAETNIAAMQPLLHIDYFALQLAYPEELMGIDFLDETVSILHDLPEYATLYSKMADDESKETLEAITDFRLNRNIKSLERFRFRLKDQYFEPFVSLGRNPTFIDGGGFDGGTTRQFAHLWPYYNKVYYFEPNADSFIKSSQNMEGLAHIDLFQKGLWHREEKLFFDNSLGSASKLSNEGGSFIETVALDDVVNGHVDFIKLDIEGAEINALKGARQIIIRDKPALAVCVYHKQTDFVKIPELVLGYNPAYRIYLRHYTQGVFETVMYFV